jgi:hypothetical protein
MLPWRQPSSGKGGQRENDVNGRWRKASAWHRKSPGENWRHQRNRNRRLGGGKSAAYIRKSGGGCVRGGGEAASAERRHAYRRTDVKKIWRQLVAAKCLKMKKLMKGSEVCGGKILLKK